MNPHRLITVGCVLAAIGFLVAAASRSGQIFWPPGPDTDARRTLDAARTRVEALRGARVAASDEDGRRFDVLLGAFGVDAPAALAPLVVRIEADRTAERRDGTRRHDVDMSIAEMESALDGLERRTPPPEWLATVGTLGILLVGLGVGALIFGHRAYRRERRAIAVFVGMDPRSSGEGRLVGAVKAAIYAERLKAVRTEEQSAVDASGRVRRRSSARNGYHGGTGEDAGLKLPMLAVPRIVLEAPVDSAVAPPLCRERDSR